jgi:16S rRNA (adenine(1408)-N(1))-methyltransferase
VVVDLGTGDGRSALARAAAEPATLVFGVDAAATAMAESSRRADRARINSVVFLAAGAETLPTTPLADAAHLVTVIFPWGSLLRGVLGLDEAALCGVAAVVRPGGRVEVLVSVVPSDRVTGLQTLDASAEPAIASAWAAAGLCLDPMRPATRAEIDATRSSWARRLDAGADARPVWRLTGARPIVDGKMTGWGTPSSSG